MKFDYKSYSNHLESENERLNAIIDEIEEINEDHLTEIFMLNLKIKKAIEYIKQYNLDGVKLDSEYFYDCLIELLEILGDKENEETQN